MSQPQPEGIGCRGATITAIAFVLAAAAVWTAGFLLGRPESCTGACEWASFTLLFTGGPISALFTVLGGTDLVIGWPVDIIAWVMLGVAHQKLSHESDPWSPPWTRWAVRVFIGVAAYAGFMALLVARVR